MKFFLSSIIVATTFFSATETKAQSSMSSMMGYPYGRPGYSNSSMGGMDRSIGTTQYGNGKKKTDPTSTTDLLDNAINHLETELTLDTFQKTVIKDLMEKNQAEEKKVLEQDIPDESKIEKFSFLRSKLDDDIKKMLSPEQQEKFNKMNEKLKKKK